ncbi:hypothetical protein J0895_18870 [Phormidium pseudopriestleyi FRX01]|uniref:Uncharacterized protein n=1 Tax=Phormidium pseudopriestleyi FRX01 TaxID=1759528 RepID=A0ABS3FVI0_9CYAN|nr:hypothetical protein [Phormidium pseudopriestleyi]MBO0351096.1 hypothetical protein [Phormidium pseudopriestleyi FRX01]
MEPRKRSGQCSAKAENESYKGDRRDLLSLRISDPQKKTVSVSVAIIYHTSPKVAIAELPLFFPREKYLSL